MSSLIQRLIEYERDIQYGIQPPPGQPTFVYEAGSLPVILSAPHGAVCRRNGSDKAEDEYTAGFARLLAALTGAHVIYTRYRSESDPNYDADVPYKLTLQQVVEQQKIGFVLDLHGAKEDKPFGLALGTMRAISCPDHRALIIDTLSQAGFRADAVGLERLDVDRAFPAAGGNGVETITGFSWLKLNTPAAQLEINAHLRIAHRKDDASQAEKFAGDLKGIQNLLLTLQRLTLTLTQQ